MTPNILFYIKYGSGGDAEVFIKDATFRGELSFTTNLLEAKTFSILEKKEFLAQHRDCTAWKCAYIDAISVPTRTVKNSALDPFEMFKC